MHYLYCCAIYKKIIVVNPAGGQCTLPFRPVSINHCRIGFTEIYVSLRPPPIYQKRTKLIRLSARKGYLKGLKASVLVSRGGREVEDTGHFNFTPRHTSIAYVYAEIAVNICTDSAKKGQGMWYAGYCFKKKNIINCFAKLATP